MSDAVIRIVYLCVTVVMSTFMLHFVVQWILSGFGFIPVTHKYRNMCTVTVTTSLLDFYQTFKRQCVKMLNHTLIKHDWGVLTGMESLPDKYIVLLPTRIFPCVRHCTFERFVSVPIRHRGSMWCYRETWLFGQQVCSSVTIIISHAYIQCWLKGNEAIFVTEWHAQLFCGRNFNGLCLESVSCLKSMVHSIVELTEKFDRIRCTISRVCRFLSFKQDTVLFLTQTFIVLVNRWGAPCTTPALFNRETWKMDNVEILICQWKM